MDPELVRLSRFMSLVLRHQPEKIGLSLDQNGWASTEELIAHANQHGVPLTRELLLQVVRENDKQRFALSEDGERIRASQGHSIAVDLELEPVVPPELLYHGTATRFLASIQRQGLLAGRRNYVHLSPNVETAMQVGRRHGRPAVLIVQAGPMHRAGHVFYRSANGVWLTAQVPVEYLVWPEAASGTG